MYVIFCNFHRIKFNLLFCWLSSLDLLVSFTCKFLLLLGPSWPKSFRHNSSLRQFYCLHKILAILKHNPHRKQPHMLLEQHLGKPYWWGFQIWGFKFKTWKYRDQSQWPTLQPFRETFGISLKSSRDIPLAMRRSCWNRFSLLWFVWKVRTHYQPIIFLGDRWK